MSRRVHKIHRQTQVGNSKIIAHLSQRKVERWLERRSRKGTNEKRKSIDGIK